MLATEQALSCGNATRMQLYREDSPKVSFMMREMKRDEFAVVDGCLALLDDDFANEWFPEYTAFEEVL